MKCFVKGTKFLKMLYVQLLEEIRVNIKMKDSVFKEPTLWKWKKVEEIVLNTSHQGFVVKELVFSKHILSTGRIDHTKYFTSRILF